MSKKQAREGAKANFQKMQIAILAVYIAIVFVMLIAITSLILDASTSIMSNRVGLLVKANSSQLQMNINNYLENAETTATLLFSDEEFYEYSPENSDLDEYSRIKLQERLENRIIDLALMENFTDFVVLYPNGERVGLTSNTTAALYNGQDMYKSFAACINDENKEDGWAFGVEGLIDRLYYVKRLNPDAILLTSFYTRELSTVFEYPKELSGMEICLIDDNDMVLYSSNAELIGQIHDQRGLVNDSSHDSSLEGGCFVYINRCTNGYRVVCTIDKSVVFESSDRLRNYAILLAVVLGIVFTIGGLLVIIRLTKPVDESVTNLETEILKDRLSDLFNKAGFHEVVSKKLAGITFGEAQCFIMIDMDNFKLINDTLGHAYGDLVITRMGHLLGDNYGRQYIVGRLGGDEFAMYFGFKDEDRETALASIIKDVEKMFKAFDIEFAEEKKSIPISLSIGITVQNDERRFDNLYENADKALYQSKHSGKNRYTVFEKDMDEAKEENE